MKTTTLTRIADKIKVSEDEYINMAYETGCIYLEGIEHRLIHQQGNDPERAKYFVRVFMCSRVWWLWWRYEWEAADRAFLRSGSKSKTDYAAYQLSREIIPPEKIIDQIFKNDKGANRRKTRAEGKAQAAVQPED